ncbi:MAG: hypothetical protein EBS38_05690 [Actinobacteria bacterium]|nr:hypothetical protein [Actinomycetota bacterium]
MRKIFQELYGSSKLLVPKGKYRMQLVLLVLIAASIPVIELLVAKLFTDLVVNGANKPLIELIVAVVIFAVLFISTRTANYLQKTYRVKFFDKAFGADTREKSKTKESWEWAMGLELVNVLSFLTQLFVIAAFFFALSPLFAGLNMLLVLIVLQVMGVLFKRQLKKQRGFVEKKRAKKEVTPAERLGSRIQQAEFGTLLASFGVVLLLGLLIWFSLEGFVSLSNTIVLFLGLRLQNTTFSSVSSSLMRFARAKANSF